MSLAANSGSVESEGVASFNVLIDSLAAGEELRSGGLDEAHVTLLAEMEGRWPPILVWGDDCMVVDGAHRVAAARRLGYCSIEAVRFQGSRDEAFIEAVRQNLHHGLPLTAPDRRRAVLRILGRHADWSDRRIGSLCGLSGKTVGRLRRAEPTSRDREKVVGLERRIGSDGRVRPVQPEMVRGKIREALNENPGSSLRTIAALVGVSPETVRTLRAPAGSIGHVGDVIAIHPAPDDQLPPDDQLQVEEIAAKTRRRRGRDERWDRDAALLTCGDGGDFARWFTRNRVDGEWPDYVPVVPVGRIYDVVDEARRRAAAWTAFASMLEGRLR
jgi:hypothetical protein